MFKLAVIALCLLVAPVGVAAEGMWLPGDLERPDLPLPDSVDRAEVAALSDLGAGPLAAVVQLGGGCSAAFVSPDGLLATAHHCVVGALPTATREGEDLLASGFHAAIRAEERFGGSSLAARRTLSMVDVTQEVLDLPPNADPDERADHISKVSARLIKRCEARGHRCEVQSFDYGNTFLLIEQEVLADVRLVFVPPHDVGYFGGDADNWRWPRHSGDFAFLRVYADPKKNRSPGYDEAHVPYRPARYLQVDRGPQPGNFIAVAGYPARTWRWTPASDLRTTFERELPTELELFDSILDIYQDAVDDDPTLASALEPGLLSLRNRQHYLRGALLSLQRGRALDLRGHRDRSLGRWLIGSLERTDAWGPVVKEVDELTAEQRAVVERDVVHTQLAARSALLQAAIRMVRWTREAQKPLSARESGYRPADEPTLHAWLQPLPSRYHAAVDRKILRLLLLRAHQLPDDQRIPELDAWFRDLPHEGSLEERLDAELDVLYSQTEALLSPERRLALLTTHPLRLEAQGGRWFTLANALVTFAEQRESTEEAWSARWAELQPRYVAALRARMGSMAGSPVYPEANGTLRVSLGVVEGFAPEDGLVALPRTTVRGMRYKANAPPYRLPEDFLEIAPGSPNSDYADAELDDVPVNFLSTADTTVGNSGSPTFTVDGRWVGILFDGNYEGMATDWVFDPALTRSIHTDASFVLWYLAEVAKAWPLIDELGGER